jgi:hypothetical protein
MGEAASAAIVAMAGARLYKIVAKGDQLRSVVRLAARHDAQIFFRFRAVFNILVCHSVTGYYLQFRS